LTRARSALWSDTSPPSAKTLDLGVDPVNQIFAVQIADHKAFPDGLQALERAMERRSHRDGATVTAIRTGSAAAGHRMRHRRARIRRA
jgi:hypothetical protein